MKPTILKGLGLAALCCVLMATGSQASRRKSNNLFHPRS